MPKTNFTKVEEVMDQGLRKMSIDQLFNMADAASNLGAEHQYSEHSTIERTKQKLIEALKRDIKYLDSKKHKSMYGELGVKKQDLKILISNPSSLTAEDWEKIKQIKAGIDKYRKEVMAQLPQENNEKLVEEERRKHINKRFNVNDKWLPLH